MTAMIETFPALPLPPANGGLRRLAAAALSALSLTLPLAGASRAEDFPGTGRKFVADFTQFRFEQFYPSASRLTWAPLNADGSRGPSQSVDVRVQPVADGVFVVTWQEANKTTIVQVQDYGKKRIYSHLTMPDGTFLQLQGSFQPAD
jgi:hypothetical protein